MDRYTTYAQALWGRWTDLVAAEPMLVGAIAAGLIVLLLGAVVLGRLARRRRTAPPERREELVRRPVYLDSVILSDVLGHLEATDHSRNLRILLEDESEEELRTPEEQLTSRRDDQVRSLNKAIAAAAQRQDLAVDLDKNPDSELKPGQVIRVTGQLDILPATRVATLLERGVPLYGREGRLHSATAAPSTRRGAHDDDTDTLLLVNERTSLDTSRPSIVAEFKAPHVSGGRILLALEPEALERDSVPAATVSMLAIVDRTLGRRERLDLDDFLRPHLSLQVRSALGSRDLMEVAEPLAKATGDELKRRDLRLTGPGATVTPAAIWG